MFDNFLGFLFSKQYFFSFATQSHAESFRNYLKKSVWDLKRANLNQNIFLMYGHAQKDAILASRQHFFYGFNVLLSFLAEK